MRPPISFALCGAPARIAAPLLVSSASASVRTRPFRRAVLGASVVTSRAALLSLAQALLGSRARCALLHGFIALARWVPGLRTLAAPFAPPLALLWAAGAALRVLSPRSWRSAQFWKKAVYIYSRYKLTQVAARGKSDDRRAKMWAKRHEWGGRRVYDLCVSLRGFYLKDGQYLGSRRDFVPSQWCDELKLLQDHVPPVPWAQVEETLRRSFYVNRAQQLFAWIDKTPLASATIAQVHRGTLRDGTDIVLKAQYKEQEKLCEYDLRNLKWLAAFLEKTDMDFFDLGAVCREFEAQIPGEFDFVMESVHMTLIAENMRRAGLGDIVVPRAIPGMVSRRAMAMTFIDGVRADNLLAMKLWNIKPERVVEAVGRAVGQQMLVDGHMHADLHLGNLLVQRTGSVAIIDYGQTKRLPESLRLKLCQFYYAMSTGHHLFIAKAFSDLGIELDVPEDKEAQAEALRMLPLYANGLLDTAPLPPDIDISPFSSNSPLQKLPIRTFPSELFMVLRTVGALRALTDTLDVEVAMSRVFAPFARRGAKVRVDASEEARRERRAADALTTGVANPLTQPAPSALSRLLPGWY